MKKILLFLLFLLTAFSLWPDQITKVGIIDLSAIISNYFRESQAWRELEEMTRKFEEDKERIIKEIEQLQQKKIEAENSGNDSLALRIQDEIFSKREYLKEFTTIKSSQIRRKKETLMESPTFLAEVLAEIQYIAESEGFSVVFRAKDPNLMWWSPEADITETVLERLRKKAQTN